MHAAVATFSTAAHRNCLINYRRTTMHNILNIIRNPRGSRTTVLISMKKYSFLIAILKHGCAPFPVEVRYSWTVSVKDRYRTRIDAAGWKPFIYWLPNERSCRQTVLQL
jgi:hypothetical protein